MPELTVVGDWLGTPSQEALLNDFYIKYKSKITHIKKIIQEEKLVQPLGKARHDQHQIAAAEAAKPAIEIKRYADLEVYSLQQLTELQHMINILANEPVTTGQELLQSQVKQNKLRKKVNDHFPVVMVYFDLGKTAFKPTKALTDILIPAAKTASEIHLRGRTDSIIASKLDARIAQGRANNAKAYLIKKGVDPEIITINSLAEGEFLLPLKPASSKKKNRRVEIEIRP